MASRSRARRSSRRGSSRRSKRRSKRRGPSSRKQDGKRSAGGTIPPRHPIRSAALRRAKPKRKGSRKSASRIKA